MYNLYAFLKRGTFCLNRKFSDCFILQTLCSCFTSSFYSGLFSGKAQQHLCRRSLWMFCFFAVGRETKHHRLSFTALHVGTGDLGGLTGTRTTCHRDAMKQSTRIYNQIVKPEAGAERRCDVTTLCWNTDASTQSSLWKAKPEFESFEKMTSRRRIG